MLAGLTERLNGSIFRTKGEPLCYVAIRFTAATHQHWLNRILT